jgi:heptosyltransferase-2
VPPSTWSALCDELAHRTDMPMALVCGPGEEAALLEARAGAKRSRVLPIVEPAAGLPELVALCSLAALFATADSGPRHVAVAVGTPVLVACGPTDPRHTADHLDATRIVRVEVPCGPCHREHCPLTGAEHHLCMRRIEVGALADAAEALLRYHSAPSRTAVTP